MASVKKSVYRWCWGRLVANKPPFYYTKCPFWPQNLIFGTTGSLEQFENFMKKHLNSFQTLKRNTKCFWISIKSEIKVSSAFGVAIKCWWWGLPISCGVTCYPGFVVTRAPRSKIQEKIIPGLFLWFLFLAHGVTCYPVTLGCKSPKVNEGLFTFKTDQMAQFKWTGGSQVSTLLFNKNCWPMKQKTGKTLETCYSWTSFIERMNGGQACVF